MDDLQDRGALGAGRAPQAGFKVIVRPKRRRDNATRGGDELPPDARFLRGRQIVGSHGYRKSINAIRDHANRNTAAVHAERRPEIGEAQESVPFGERRADVHVPVPRGSNGDHGVQRGNLEEFLHSDTGLYQGAGSGHAFDINTDRA